MELKVQREKFNRYVITSENGPRLEIPVAVMDQIEFLNKRNPNNEWSGIIFYSVEEGSLTDVENLKFVAKHIYLMDIGSSGATDYRFNREVSEFLYDYAEKNGIDEDEIFVSWKIGHIHSHHTMGVNPSSVDIEEIEDNIRSYPAYLTVIVNNGGAAKGFLNIYYDEELQSTFKGRDYDGTEISFIGKKTVATIDSHQLVIYPEVSTKVSDEFKQRYEKIKSTVKHQSTALVKDSKKKNHTTKEQDFKKLKEELEKLSKINPEEDIDELLDNMVTIDFLIPFMSTERRSNVSKVTTAIILLDGEYKKNANILDVIKINFNHIISENSIPSKSEVENINEVAELLFKKVKEAMNHVPKTVTVGEKIIEFLQSKLDETKSFYQIINE